LPVEIFLSYASEDLDVASRLATFLSRRQFKPFLAPNSLPMGMWLNEIGAALSRCEWFFVILSPAAIQSMWVQRELTYALTQKRLLHRIVPILWKPCDPDELSWVLRCYQRIDIDVDFETGAEELLRRLGIPPEI
jgi:hypothetical protein